MPSLESLRRSDPALRVPRTGLVLSGGGARGAYEVGIVTGIVEVLGLRGGDPPPFRIYAGTSVGAINASYFAAHSHRGDLEVAGLVREWCSLALAEHLRVDLLGLVGWPHSLPLLRRRHQLDSEHLGPLYGRSLLDPRPLEKLVRTAIPWSRMHANVLEGHVHALIIAALDVGSGRTHIFTELAPGAVLRPSKDPRRLNVPQAIEAEHVLASAAIPFLFPSRRIGRSYYCDGGMRFNTPLAPAIRQGADRLVVVSLRRGVEVKPPDAMEDYPDPVFLVGKLMAALLLDPIDYDLEVLQRFNALLEVLEKNIGAAELEKIDDLMYRTRGARYRRVETLAFRPSEDIGRLTADYVRHRPRARRAGRIAEWLLHRTARMEETFEADLVSFLLFDGAFAERLVDLGIRDARANADRIRAFFEDA